ncbi:hypothetical protein Pcac1_g8637 [Phytophthora cactorum]|nr:hypothetical protein Pcac1_g8637 [Phytophthora cactorum]KAG2913995.1 hypothetical protein PC114_g8346 [Phytophthora cactorum]
MRALPTALGAPDETRRQNLEGATVSRQVAALSRGECKSSVGPKTAL